LDEAEKPIDDYPCLQDFFIRHLKPSIRPISLKKNVVICPCDGTLSVLARIENKRLIQAKGKYYNADEFLGDTFLASRFINGHYATIYLSPRDYHRFHVPIDGSIQKTIYIPGALWPVNNWAVDNIRNLFCQNERVITVIADARTNRLVAHVAVGATMVGCVNLEYCDLLHRRMSQKSQGYHINHIDHDEISVTKGQELGQFMFGSTIILLFEAGLIDGFVKEAPASVKMGELLGSFV
jgi:phosphatidylserine decarboxylase